ncbi:MAG TPA: ribosomal protein S18-alanine N-acetyltransferase [Thermoanaerobaculia bacterium]
MNVRPARAEDLDRVARLEELSFQDPWDRESLARELADPRVLLLVVSREPDGPLGGYALFRRVADEAELLRVGVDPAERRHGLARALILEGLRRLQDGEIQVCFLEVRIDNVPAITLYETLGFGRAGFRKAYYRDGTDALILALEM